LNTVAKAGQQIGTHLAPAKYRDRGRECFQVEANRDFRFARHDAAADVFIPSFEMHTERIDTGWTQSPEPSKIGGWLTLSLNWQTGTRLNGERALREYGRASIFRGRRSRSHHHVLDGIKVLRGSSHFGQLFRSLFSNGSSSSQRFANCAELTLRRTVSVTNTGLE